MPDFLVSSTHVHITAWVVALILFFVAAAMQKGSKGRKITHMILRVFYILVIFSGSALFIETIDWGMGMEYGIKMLLGLFLIGFMEMVLVRGEKGKSTKGLWIALVIILVLILVLGFRLPMGFNFFG